MPHQCLQCGKVFPSGSPEILKGCGDCGGKKFFYTEQAVSEDERQRLTEQANKDIKVLIHEILAQRSGESFKTYDSEGQTSAPGADLAGSGSGWVKIIPKTGEGKAEAGAKDSAEPEAAAVELKDHGSVKQFLEELREKSDFEIVPVEEPTVKTRPKKKGKVKLRRRIKKGLKKTEHRPEVIKVIEPGVYEIYLSKLLKHFPIIINRDGTYLVHLPSLFDEYGREQK
jgi:predicted  nucleic acid-binding Zn-ribbon protein